MNKVKSKKVRPKQTSQRPKRKKAPARSRPSTLPASAPTANVPGRASSSRSRFAGPKPLRAQGKVSRKGRILKKHPQKVKAPPSKPAAPPRRRPTPEEIAYQKALARFENGLQLFNHHQVARARAIFERLTDNPVRELAERARVYLHICEQRLTRTSLHLKTAEDFYNYAVSLSNQGHPEEAEQYLKKALKLAPKSDYIYYALATTHALRENIEGALENLLKAIELNERNRYQAQNDPDFSNLLEDPRFTELLYPEKPLT